MTEEESRTWVLQTFGPDVFVRLETFAVELLAEQQQQNLIASTTIPLLWSRHIVDSLQLLRLTQDPAGHWLDIGTGAGFPGLVLAIATTSFRFTLTEPRRRRAEFLQHMADQFRLDHVVVKQTSARTLSDGADVISARAVGALEMLLIEGSASAGKDTLWILPRGRSGAELSTQLRSTKMTFHVEHSITDPAAVIAVLRGRPR